MPSLEVQSHGIPAVSEFRALLEDLLQHAASVKLTASIEPALDESEFIDLQTRLSAIFPTEPSANGQENVDQKYFERKKAQRYAVIETATRDIFSSLIATTSIDSPAFAKVWNLFDILSILSDSSQCEPALLLWLVEELLDSQTIGGCRKVFDYLESRRERITAKHFDQKKLVILRTCNELLRRLSRAEDTAFCGRVFIFLYQSFPLGDRSSVNLRGEYHVENVTTFEETIPNDDENADRMALDKQPDVDGKSPEPKSVAKTVSSDDKKPLAPEALYPIFWSLQSAFNQPKKLFDPAEMASFKAGLEATIATFLPIKPDPSSKPAVQDKQGEESKGIMKRKRDDDDDYDDDDLANAFNPKYLTSPDLFELEISDLSFRRHVLVQALIVMEFIRSLSAQAKEKLNTVKQVNKSVTYSDQLISDEDLKWAAGMKKTIIEYIKLGQDGQFFHRMVEAVLSRDKHWVRWKVESCPVIGMKPVSGREFSDAKAAARKTATNKRLRSIPMGSLPLGFLSEGDAGSAMEKFKSGERYDLPEVKSFQRKIADDDFEIEMPTNNQTKAAAVESKASKSWRALRIASRYKLASFDKIDNPDRIDVVFDDDIPTEAEAPQDGEGEVAADLPEDKRAVVFCGPAGAGKSTLIKMLLEKKPGAFSKVATHITRQPREGETNGQDYAFVDVQAFNMMRDGDQFLEFTEGEGLNQGTSRRMVEAISDSGKIAIMEMSSTRAQQIKDTGYSARFVLVKPPSTEVLESRLKGSGLSVDEVNEAAKAMSEAAEDSMATELYDTILVNGELDLAYQTLEDFIYSTTKGGEQPNGVTDVDEEMADAASSGQPNGAGL